MLWNSKWQYLFSSKRNSHHTLKAWKSQHLDNAGIKRAGIQFNLRVLEMCFEILLLSDTALISPHTIWGWAVTQPEPVAMPWHKPHHPVVWNKRNKSPESALILTGFSWPRGRGDTVPVTLTTDSTGALDRSSFTWECACRERTESEKFKEQDKSAVAKHLNPKSLLRQGKQHWGCCCSVRSGLSRHFNLFVSQSTQSDKVLPFLCVCLSFTKENTKSQTHILVALTSSWGMMIWVSPWKSLRIRNRPCLIHEKHKRKNIFFTNLVVSTFWSIWQLATLSVPHNSSQSTSKYWITHTFPTPEPFVSHCDQPQTTCK